MFIKCFTTHIIELVHCFHLGRGRPCCPIWAHIWPKAFSVSKLNCKRATLYLKLIFLDAIALYDSICINAGGQPSVPILGTYEISYIELNFLKNVCSCSYHRPSSIIFPKINNIYQLLLWLGFKRDS